MAGQKCDRHFNAADHALRAVSIIASVLCAAVAWSLTAHADDVSVAVAANFLGPIKRLQAPFEQETGHRLLISGGSTGELYTQIKHGAPFDVFLAADQARPQALEAAGMAATGSRFTYAIGRLVLWSADDRLNNADGPTVLAAGDFNRLAIANPKTAPYGEAAIQALQELGLDEALRPKLVQGQSLAQTYQFVASGGAELGFVALSQIRTGADGEAPKGSAWLVPQDLHEPIRQDAVLLARAEGKAASVAFLDFLKSAEARAIIEASGYDALP
jgi:molybdate transport system substrate-binding protein